MEDVFICIGLLQDVDASFTNQNDWPDISLQVWSAPLGRVFDHFGRESGMVFERNMGVYKRIYRFSQFQMSKKEREICQFDMDLKNFLFGSNLIVT